MEQMSDLFLEHRYFQFHDETQPGSQQVRVMEIGPTNRITSFMIMNKLNVFGKNGFPNGEK